MHTYDHIIIGGGLIGASIAWHLARQTNQSIVVLERNGLASAASSLAAGLVLQVTGNANNTPLAKLSRDTITTLAQDWGQPTGFHESGSIRITDTDNSSRNLNLLIKEAKNYHIPVELINADTARQKVPWLDTSNAKTIVHFPTDGYVDPYQLSMAYIKSARQLGTRFETQCAVDKILHENGKIVGVSTSIGKIYGSTVINAAGAWSSVLNADAGFPLPFVPVRSHYWIAKADTKYGGEHPVVILPDAAAYTRPETGGLLVGIQESESCTFNAMELPDNPVDFSITKNEEHWDILIKASQIVAKRFPGINQAEFTNYIAGLSTYSPDGQLVLGEIKEVAGLFVASGCCGSGVMLSAGIGKAAACLMTNKKPPFDLTPFDVNRFGQVNPYSDSFRQRCGKARSMKSSR